ncbi:hypothetical protein [Mycobacterium avium]|uniref:hypothetical protein n=1 Tax=Mycobacterium avium TaxID=1764 RepID=UPI001143A781|nr:hypothetical protein [Mycobacterium avium]
MTSMVAGVGFPSGPSASGAAVVAPGVLVSLGAAMVVGVAVGIGAQILGGRLSWSASDSSNTPNSAAAAVLAMMIGVCVSAENVAVAATRQPTRTIQRRRRGAAAAAGRSNEAASGAAADILARTPRTNQEIPTPKG